MLQPQTAKTVMDFTLVAVQGERIEQSHSGSLALLVKLLQHTNSAVVAVVAIDAHDHGFVEFTVFGRNSWAATSRLAEHPAPFVVATTLWRNNVGANGSHRF